MKEQNLKELGYQVPIQFNDENYCIAYLERAGFKTQKIHIGKLYYLLNQLRVKCHIGKNINEDGWVKLNYEVLNSVFGDLKFFYMLLNQFKADGWVEVLTNKLGVESYQAGVISKQYRLTQNINEVDWVVVKRNASICKTTRGQISYYQQNWQPVDHSIYEMLTQFRIDEIDFLEQTTIETFLQSKFESELQLFREKAIKNLRKRRKVVTEEAILMSMKVIYMRYKVSYISIKEGAWRYKPDKHGRRHTNITNLPKYLRRHLYILKGGNKRRLCEVDVKNSQVLLLLLILPKRLKGYKEFKELVEKGIFYEFLIEKLSLQLTQEIRDKTKEQFFVFIYGEPNEPYVFGSKMCKIMQKEFPELVSWLRNCKLQNGVDGYKIPARRMQEEESDIIINMVCAKAIKQKIFFTQIYDSILCFEEDVEVINGLVKTGFRKKGLMATTNIDKAREHSVINSQAQNF